MTLFRLLRRWNRWYFFCILAVFLCFIFLSYNNVDQQRKIPNTKYSLSDRRLNSANYNSYYDRTDNSSDLVYYKKDTALIWIGGVPRSGTTLMRAMIDAHPDVRCGEETRVIPRILGMHTGMSRSNLEMNRLKEAKIDETVLNNALAAYILSIISLHGEPAPRLCNKDPFTLRSMSRIIKMFPKSKFLLMIRDGRATAHSIISRRVTIKGFDIKTYRGAIRDWNRAITAMFEECSRVGPSVCLPVHYEQLVLHPKSQMETILNFLDIPWNDLVIHHEKTIGQTGGVSLSKRELSTDQVDKPVNIGALTKWVEYIPDDVKRDMRSIAPMLQKLGYDPEQYPPHYGTPDDLVLRNSQDVEKEKKKLKEAGIDVDQLEQDKIVERQDEERRMMANRQQAVAKHLSG